MKFTLSWLTRHLETDADLATITRTLTAVGLEVEAVEDRRVELAPFVVARVLSADRHPDADRLKVCLVDAGQGPVKVVCGAPNARAGMLGVFAAAGTTIPRNGLLLKPSVIRGQESNGMLCSAYEMGLSDDHEGIIDLPADAPVGVPFAPWLGADDPLIEIAVTPNRADALGVRGIARDLAAAGLGRLIAMPTPPLTGTFQADVAIHLKAGADCPMFAARVLRGVKNGPSPAWLRAKLERIGLRSISTLVDVTNWLTFDRNRPLHVFDIAKLKGDLVVHPAVGGERLAALNGKEYVLAPGMVAISDDSGVVSLGGVIGGAGTGVDAETTEVLIEAALFDPRRTATTGRALSLVTDARFRFERGIDPDFVTEGLDIGAALMIELCGGAVSSPVVAGAAPDWRRQLRLRHDRVATLAGVDVPVERQRRILVDLGFAVSDGAETLNVVPPGWRGDIEGEADLVEEVARINGFDAIEAVAPPRLGVMPPVAVTAAQRRVSTARRALAALGLHEAVTWSFMSGATARLFGGGDPTLTLVNPIASDLDQMRPSALPNLMLAAKRNHDRSVAGIGLFEVGPAYRGIAPTDQEMVAAWVRSGDRPRHWRAPGGAYDVHDVKADLWTLLAALGFDPDKTTTTTDVPDWYHPGRAGVVRLGPKTMLGRFGQVHPDVARALDLDRPLVMGELFLDALPAVKAKGRARQVPTPRPFQPVTRDFAFLVADDVAADTVLRAAKGAAKDLIDRVELFDVYQGGGLPPGKRSLAIAVTLQPTDRTLTDADIEAASTRVVDAVTRATGGALRG
jgi:phenylalanyl-tRNA synthetase beta chain